MLKHFLITSQHRCFIGSGSGEASCCTQKAHMGQALKRNQNSINTALGREGVQGCACHDGGYSERSSGCWGFDAVMWNGWGKEDYNSPLCLVSAPAPLSSLQQTLIIAKLIIIPLRLSPHVCHPSRCLDHSFSLTLCLALPFSLHIVLCFCPFSHCLLFYLHISSDQTISILTTFMSVHDSVSLPINMHCDSAVSSSPLLRLSLPSVSCSICGLCQVSSQPGGRGDLLWTDCPVGQPQSPSDPRPEDSSVCCCAHCKADMQAKSSATKQNSQHAADLFSFDTFTKHTTHNNVTIIFL